MQNLTRKLRPKNFDEIIGQDLIKSMLKNSLYASKIFPAYLFFGQRGCGKTSTARIFATALNCKNLPSFQKDPKATLLPCQNCDSCIAMQAARHPDFVELDAASNTGVDNIRQLLEESMFQPLLGQWRIYLIDEAHMLSKSAFNAMLKTLEEPSVKVLFILATTEIEKIPATIKSRCFLGIFPALDPNVLDLYLQDVCLKENIEFEKKALSMIIDQAQGCPRDALNLLEQAYFYSQKVDEKTVQTLFKICSGSKILNLVTNILERDVASSSALLQELLVTTSPQTIFDLLLSAFVFALQAKLGAEGDNMFFHSAKEELSRLASFGSAELEQMINFLWKSQQSFLESPSKKNLIIFFVTRMALWHTSFTGGQEEKIREKGSLNSVTASKSLKAAPSMSLASEKPESLEIASSAENSVAPVSQATQPLAASGAFGSEINSPKVQEGSAVSKSPWSEFILHLAGLKLGFISNLLSQAQDVSFDEDKKLVRVKLSKMSQMFIDSLAESRSKWQHKLEELVGCVDILLERSVTSAPASSVAKPVGVTKDAKPPFTSSKPAIKASAVVPGSSATTLKTANLEEKWPKAAMLLKAFPGKIKKIG